jgi:hypothetical protein
VSLALAMAALMGVLSGLPTRASAQPPTASPATRAGAWTLPDAESLVRQAIRRIITQDRPAGIPVAEYSATWFGRAATTAAIRQYSGHTLTSDAFAPIAGWPEGPSLDVTPCETVDGVGCQPPSAVWIAVTRIERGELPREIHLWYTTQFMAPPAREGQHSQRHRYTFCERWLRIGGVWKYDGFVKMVPQ